MNFLTPLCVLDCVGFALCMGIDLARKGLKQLPDRSSDQSLLEMMLTKLHKAPEAVSE